jgi:putative membrane protein
MMRRIIVALGVALAALTTAAAAPTANKADQNFLKQAIQGNLAEVELGKLAQEKSMNDRVRSFGDTLVKDHSAGNEKATEVASAVGVTAPTEPSKKQKMMYDRLSKLSGSAFDRQFARMMVDDHQKDIKEFEKEAKSSNEQIAGFAKDTLPTLQKHLDTAKSLASGKS